MAKKQRLTPGEVKHVSKLASLPLSEKEIALFLPQLLVILDFVSKLQEIDTSKITSTFQITGQENVFRDDEIDTVRMLTQEEALANAKSTHNGFFKVPWILKN